MRVRETLKAVATVFPDERFAAAFSAQVVGLHVGNGLDPATEIQFLRIKNSWGGARPDRAFAPGMPGYHDLYLDYLNGPIARCVETDGVTDTSNCPTQTTPLQNMVLPPGY